MELQLPSLPYTELLHLKAKVDAEIANREQEEKNKAKKQILEIAKSFNLSVEEVLAKGGSSSRRPAEAKYRNPNNPEQTWSGRGRKPVWASEWLAAGKSLDDLLI